MEEYKNDIGNCKGVFAKHLILGVGMQSFYTSPIRGSSIETHRFPIDEILPTNSCTASSSSPYGDTVKKLSKQKTIIQWGFVFVR